MTKQGQYVAHADKTFTKSDKNWFLLHFTKSDKTGSIAFNAIKRSLDVQLDRYQTLRDEALRQPAPLPCPIAAGSSASGDMPNSEHISVTGKAWCNTNVKTNSGPLSRGWTNGRAVTHVGDGGQNATKD